MKALLERIKKEGKIPRSEFKSYHDIGTLNALSERALIRRNDDDDTFELSSLTDGLLQKYVNIEKAKAAKIK